MRTHNHRLMGIRREIESARVDVDVDSDPLELGEIARDAYAEAYNARVDGSLMDALELEEQAVAITASIPPVVLGRTTYVVASAGSVGMELIGPRGGHSSLVRNEKHPDQWAHVTMSGMRARYTWYRRSTDGTFSLIK